MRRIDDFFFDVFPAFQKISEWVEYCTYMTHLTQARLLMGVGTALYCSFAMQLIFAENHDGWRYIFGQGFVAFLFLVISQMYDQRGQSGPETRNWLRGHMYVVFIRIGFVCLSTGVCLQVFFGMSESWRAIAPATNVIAYYFLSCDGLPPGDRLFDRLRRLAHV